MNIARIASGPGPTQPRRSYGTMSPFLDATQPWVIGFNGEGPMASLQANEVFARVWIDQDLKEAMGH